MKRQITEDDRQWQKLWTSPEDQQPDLEALQARFKARTHRQRWKTRLEYLVLLLGMIFTIGLLLIAPLTPSLVVLVLFCWTIWGISIWGQRAAKKSGKEVLTKSPTEFVEAMKEFSEYRQQLMQLGNYLLVAVGVFMVVWSAWMASQHIDVYTREPWRAVVGFGGIVVFYLFALFLHRKERDRLQKDLAGLEELEQRLTVGHSSPMGEP